MTRSSCLAVLFACAATLATTTAVAQSEPPPEAQPEPANPTPSPEPAAGTADSPQPAVTLGTPATSTVPADTPASSGSQETKKETRPFAGSALFVQNSMTTGTIFKGQQQDYNPTVESTLYILPRYAISDAWQLRARAVLSYEYTNSDSTTYRNEPTLSDATLQLFYRKIPTFAGIQPMIAGNLGFPTSKVSRSRTLVVSPGATLQLSRAWQHFLHGEASVISNVSYAHPFYRSRNQEITDPRPPGSFACVGGGNCQDFLSGTMNASDVLSYSIIFEVEWGKFNPAVMYLGASQWAYHPKDALNPVDGTPIERPAGFDATTVRQTHYVSTWLDYNFNSWFTGEVGFWNAVASVGNTGQRTNLIFDRYQDTRVYLGASFQLDNLVRTLQGDDNGEAGVVRAKSTKTPMWTF